MTESNDQVWFYRHLGTAFRPFSSGSTKTTPGTEYCGSECSEAFYSWLNQYKTWEIPSRSSLSSIRGYLPLITFNPWQMLNGIKYNSQSRHAPGVISFDEVESCKWGVPVTQKISNFCPGRILSFTLLNIKYRRTKWRRRACTVNCNRRGQEVVRFCTSQRKYDQNSPVLLLFQGVVNLAAFEFLRSRTLALRVCSFSPSVRTSPTIISLLNFKNNFLMSVLCYVYNR